MFFLLFGVFTGGQHSSINHCLFWRQLTTEVTERVLIKNLLQFEIVTPVTAALMQRTARYFITFTPKCFALAVFCDSRQCRTKSNVA